MFFGLQDFPYFCNSVAMVGSLQSSEPIRRQGFAPLSQTKQYQTAIDYSQEQDCKW